MPKLLYIVDTMYIKLLEVRTDTEVITHFKKISTEEMNIKYSKLKRCLYDYLDICNYYLKKLYRVYRSYQYVSHLQEYALDKYYGIEGSICAVMEEYKNLIVYINCLVLF